MHYNLYPGLVALFAFRKIFHVFWSCTYHRKWILHLLNVCLARGLGGNDFGLILSLILKMITEIEWYYFAIKEKDSNDQYLHHTKIKMNPVKVENQSQTTCLSALKNLPFVLVKIKGRLWVAMFWSAERTHLRALSILLTL